MATLGYTTESWILCITVLTVGSGFGAASYIGHVAAVYDIAPTYAGTVYGFVNMSGSITGFITPLVATGFTQYNPKDVAGWKNLFWTSCTLYFAGFIIFLIFIRLKPADFELQNTLDNSQNERKENKREAII